MVQTSALSTIRRELERLAASQVEVDIDSNFEPAAGDLAHVKIDAAEWRLPPGELEQLLKEAPDQAGPEGVKQAIEKHGNAVWHGPAPKDSRDTSSGAT